MTLAVLITTFITCVFLIGHYFPSPPATYKTSKPAMTDLRVSEFAPDLSSIPDEYTRKRTEKERKEADRLAIEATEFAEKVARRKREAEEDKQVWVDYAERITEAKLKRMLEGNPVTPQNPLTEFEKPPKPYIPYRGMFY